MNTRLVRALQRGGCAAQRGNGRWAIWRQEDRRGRIIGELSASEVEVLRLNGSLAPLGDGSAVCLVWTGPVPAQSTAVLSGVAVRASREPGERSQVPLLQRILEGCHDAREVTRLAQAVRDFLEDVTRAQQSGRASGMNWNALSSGTRIDGGRTTEFGFRAAHSADAARRLDRLREVLGPGDYKLVELMTLEAATRHRVSETLGLSLAACQRSAKGSLMRLARAYDECVSRPARPTQPLT